MSNQFTKQSNSKVALSTLAILAIALFSAAPASAQGGFTSTSQAARKGLGDGSSFYMARRQVQFVDDSPIVKYGNNAAPAGAAGFGSQQGGGQPLQRAGFTSYSSSLAPSGASSLPKVNNGVPTPVAPPPTPKSPKSLSAKAGGLSKGKKAVAAAPAAPAQPDGIHAYNSYKGYNPSASLPQGSEAGGGAGSTMSAQGNVKGSVLHWSRRRRGQ